MGTVGSGWSISCESCGLNWRRAGGLTDYERLAMESRPCPVCGAYTLSCHEPRQPAARRTRRETAGPRRAA